MCTQPRICDFIDGRIKRIIPLRNSVAAAAATLVLLEADDVVRVGHDGCSFVRSSLNLLGFSKPLLRELKRSSSQIVTHPPIYHISSSHHCNGEEVHCDRRRLVRYPCRSGNRVNIK